MAIRKKINHFCAFTLTALAFLFLLGGCGAPAAEAEAKAESGTFFAMDTVMTLSIFETARGDDPAAVLRDARALVETLERELSVTDTDSAVYAVNRDGSGTVSPDASGLLRTALELCARTDGALDITIYPVSLAWGFTTGDYEIPDRETLDALLERVDYTRVRVEANPEAKPVNVALDEGMMLDLGAVAKGFVGDRLWELILARCGEEASALLDLGGNVVAVGAKPDGKPWRIGVRDPDNEMDIAGIIEAADQCVVTSGDYERYFERGGARYCHILDPATGEPARAGLRSVTVVSGAGYGAMCDAYATALFVMGPEQAAAFWRDNGGFDMILIGADGGVTITEGLADSFVLSESYKNAPLTVLR